MSKPGPFMMGLVVFTAILLGVSCGQQRLATPVFSATPSNSQMSERQNDLSQVRVAALYEAIIDQMRDVDEVGHLMQELHTGYSRRTRRSENWLSGDTEAQPKPISRW